MMDVLVIRTPKEDTQLIVITDSPEARDFLSESFDEKDIVEHYTSDDVRVIVDGKNEL